MINLNEIEHLVKSTYHEWIKQKPAILGAAIAFYVIFSLGPILVITIIGIWHFHPDFIFKHAFVSGNYYVSLSKAASLTVWAFIGIEAASIPYDFVINPQKNIPLATLLGTLIAAIVYIGSSIIIIGVLPHAMLIKSTAPFLTLATLLFGHIGKWIMLAGVVISCLGCINGSTLLLGQVAMAAANDKLFPSIFAQKNQVGVPGYGYLVTAVLQSALLILLMHKEKIEQFQLIALLASLASLLPYLYTNAAGIVLFKTPEQKRQKYNNIFIAIAILAGAYSFWSIFSSGLAVVYHGAILLFASVLIFGWIIID